MNDVPTQHAEAREERFGYVCHACSRCCHHKLIQTNPYEIARLARNRGVSTGEFSERWTIDGAGTHLSQTAEGACVFLGEQGCTVHPDRPLVCRLYPLGRRRMADGSENWQHVEPHPQSKGEYTREGTIADFLEQQGAQPFIDAADAYVDWVNDAREMLAAGNLPGAGDAQGGDVLDMDSAITAYCAGGKIEPPDDIEARKHLHLKLLYELLRDIDGDSDG